MTKSGEGSFRFLLRILTMPATTQRHAFVDKDFDALMANAGGGTGFAQ